jgi:hypothetical protein
MFTSEKDFVMKEEQKEKFKWISFRVTPHDYDLIYSHLKKSRSRKMSDYARRVLLQKPVVVTYRNQSTDDFLSLAMGLFKTLNGIGNNFNQAVKKLHTLRDIQEFRTWYMTWSVERQTLLNKIDEVKRLTVKMIENGSQDTQPK